MEVDRRDQANELESLHECADIFDNATRGRIALRGSEGERERTRANIERERERAEVEKTLFCNPIVP